MLYGFGDVENPRQDTIELVEDMVVEYISDLVPALWPSPLQSFRLLKLCG